MKNFFEHQRTARQRTQLLVMLYITSVVGTVILTYLLVWGIFSYPHLVTDRPSSATSSTVRGILHGRLFEPQLFLLVTGTVVLLIGGMTALKLAELSSGGKAVAEMLGGRLVTRPTHDFREKRLLNVVEEMAIASGVPVPPVYIMESEDGINAFAAGYSPDQAVIGVSRGALEYLNRDELQGVIAHEFSHILNGDMRLNIRLIAVIFGIMGLAAFGSILMRTRSGDRSRSDRGAGQVILLGLGLYLLGIVGAFFGNLIKAMVSRQREYLADASAVQFTRNPDGIGGALKKIGGLRQGAIIRNQHAPEAAHMFFADALSRLTGLFATHPPLPDRIRRIDPRWDGAFPKVSRPTLTEPAEVEREKTAFGSTGRRMIPGVPPLPLPVLLPAAAAMSSPGVVAPKHRQYAEQLLASISQEIQEAVHDPFSARAVVFGLLLSSEPEVREKQLSTLDAAADRRDYGETRRLAPRIAELPDAARLPVIDLAIPTLRRMSRRQYDQFRELVEKLILADGRVSLSEYVLRSVLERHLDPFFGKKREKPAPPRPSLESSIVSVLSCLAWAGHREEADAQAAFDAALSKVFRRSSPMIPSSECRLDELDRHLGWLAISSPSDQQKLLDACFTCISHDGRITVREAEMYRAIADVVGVPVPPLVPDL